MMCTYGYAKYIFKDSKFTFYSVYIFKKNIYKKKSAFFKGENRVKSGYNEVK